MTLNRELHIKAKERNIENFRNCQNDGQSEFQKTGR